MQSSMVVAGMDALSESCENILTRRANQGHCSTIAPFVKRRWPYPTTDARLRRRLGAPSPASVGRKGRRCALISRYAFRRQDAGQKDSLCAKAELGAVTRSQLERAVLERIGLDHDDFLIRVAIVAFGREGDVAVDAGVLLELVEIADDLFRFGADILHRFSDQVR